MNAPHLFVPTYEHTAEEKTSKRPKRSRELPSKTITGTASAHAHCSRSRRSCEMPSLVFNGNIEYIQSFEAAEAVGRALKAARPHVLGFDIEWQVSFQSGQAPRPTSTLQLCVPERPGGSVEMQSTQTRDSPNTTLNHASTSEASCRSLRQPCSIWGTAFIFHLSAMRGHPSAVRGVSSPPPPLSAQKVAEKGAGIRVEQVDGENPEQKRHHCEPSAAYLPDSLVGVLSSPDILLAGVGVRGDVTRLENEYEQLRKSGVGGAIELSEVAKRKVAPERRRRGMWSLADLCAEMLKLELQKPSSLRTGSWEKRPLSVDQLFYAATDAYASLRLWQVMQTMPDLILHGSESSSPRRSLQAITQIGASNTRGVFVGTENKVPEPSSSWQRLPASKLETHRLWHVDGLSVDAVAEVRCIKASTARGYLSDCIEAGLPYDWARLGVDPEKEGDILRALMAVTGKVKQPTTATGCGKTAAPGGSGRSRMGHASSGGASGGRGAPARAAADSSRSSSCGSRRVAVDSVDAVGSHRHGESTPSEGAGVKGSSSWNGAQMERPLSEEATLLDRDTNGLSEGKTGLGYSAGGGGNRGGVGVTREEAVPGGGVGVDGANAATREGRWDSVQLKEVKELTPSAEYWEIRMVLARLKSGWCP